MLLVFSKRGPLIEKGSQMSKQNFWKFFGKIEYLLLNKIIMGQRIKITEEQKEHLLGMYGLVNEKAKMDKQVDGPFSRKGQEAVKYYIYQIGSKFYIYMTNASHKEPTLMDGTTWDNDGKGYPNEMEAKKMIDSVLRDPHHSSINEQKPTSSIERAIGKDSRNFGEPIGFLSDSEFKDLIEKLSKCVDEDGLNKMKRLNPEQKKEFVERMEIALGIYKD